MEPGWLKTLEALGVPVPACLSIVGAGGKTSTMLALAREISTTGRPVVITTTTKIWPPEGIPLLLRRDIASAEAAASWIRQSDGIVCIAESFGDRGKLLGVPAEFVCELAANGTGTVVVEADGAAGRPIKSHRPGEPVVPPCTDLLLAVVGLDAVGRSATEENVHRLDEYMAVTGVHPGAPIEAKHVARALVAAASYAPPRAKKVLVLNKADGLPELTRAQQVAAALGDLPEHERAVACRHGEIVAILRTGEHAGAA